LDQVKGKLAIGCDGDVVIWNPDRRFRVTADGLHHRHKLTPYEGQTLEGIVEKTFLRGNKIYDDRQVMPDPVGQLLGIKI
jgi:allantoinase